MYIDQVIPSGGNVWQARAAFYALFANVLSVPCSETWGDQVFALPMLEMLRDMSCDVGTTDLWQAILSEAGPPGSAERMKYYNRLEECFQRDFLVPLKGEMIPLGASAYLHDEESKESRMTFFEGLYLEFSFDWRKVFAGINGSWPNEPEHAVLVLTMLAIISQKVATTMEDSDGNDRLPGYLRLLQEIFEMTHPWLAQCFAHVASQASEKFYRFFGTFMAEFLNKDQEQWDLDMSA